MALYTRRRGSTVATIVRAIGSVIAIILGLHIVFVLFNANSANSFVRVIADWANTLALWFRDLFNTGNANADLALNFGLAIIFWVVVTGLLARLINRTA
jgi:hypothetical protein